jgi:hypothetical protein
VIHIGDPDQALTTVPVLCLCGGAVLASLVERRGSRPVWATAAAAVVVCSLLFFIPPGNLARASSYRAVASGGRVTDAAISAIEGVRERGQALIIDYGFPVSFRQISYYFPDDYVVFLPGTPGPPSSAGDAGMFFHRKLLSSYRNGTDIVLPPAKEILFLLPQGTHPRNLAPELSMAIQRGRIFYITSLPQNQFQFGAYRLRIAENPGSFH